MFPRFGRRAASRRGADRSSPEEGVPGDTAAARSLERLGVFWGSGSDEKPTAALRTTGAQVFTESFVEALVRHGTAPALDVIVPWRFMPPAQQAVRQMAARGRAGSPGTARVLPSSHVGAVCQRTPYDVLHAEDIGANVPYLRARFAPRLCAITAPLHAASYAFQTIRNFLPLLTTPSYPCDAILCPSETSRLALQSRLGTLGEQYSRRWNRPPPVLPRLEHLPYGVDSDRFSPRDQGAARSDLGLPPEGPVVLCLGRFHFQDKMDWLPLLLAFQHVTHTRAASPGGPPPKSEPLLLLAGGNFAGYGEAVLGVAAELGLAERVRTFFNVPPACVPALYAASDLFVSPSDSPGESFGLTIVEAMACGLPVIASDWNGYRELIVHGETGFLVRTDWANCLGEITALGPLLPENHQHLHVGQSVAVDVGELARFIAQLLEHPEAAREMGRRGRERVLAQYAWRTVIPRWEALWQELAAIARELEQPAGNPLAYLEVDYFEHFAHYAARLITREVPVMLTPRGSAVLGGQSHWLVYPEAQAFLQQGQLQAALQALGEAGGAEKRVAVGQLVEALCRTGGFTPDGVLRHLMWLAKYDLVAFVDEGGRPD